MHLHVTCVHNTYERRRIQTQIQYNIHISKHWLSDLWGQDGTYLVPFFAVPDVVHPRAGPSSLQALVIRIAYLAQPFL